MKTSDSVRVAARRTMAALLITGGFSVLCGCGYMGAVGKQSYYTVRNRVAPNQRIQKHMIERPTVFVYGQVLHLEKDLGPGAVAVAALTADDASPGIVDANLDVRADSYFGLNVPEGSYHLVVVADRDGDGVGRNDEVIGHRELTVTRAESVDGVVGEIDIELRARPRVQAWRAATFALDVRRQETLEQSVIYPRGTLRTLDDPIFDPHMATLGLYEPAAFLERAPMMFYALDENEGHKVPVIFVHGIDGTARQFATMVEALDRSRYQPWFFHYPSGVDLGQLSSIFYRIFLSGRVIPLEDMPIVIVAHSMGGLVVRDALSRMTGSDRENRVTLLITISSPLGGHPGAKGSQRAPVSIPSWLNLNPESPFIRGLHRRPFPAGLEYRLFYTFAGTDPQEVENATDGVVPLSSQLAAPAVAESRLRRGYADTHTDVLLDPRVIDEVMRGIQTVKTVFPEDHLHWLDLGGYAMELGPEFSPLERFMVHKLGRYMDALVRGEIQPFHPEQVKFVRACRGEMRATNPAASAWLKLQRHYGSTRPGGPSPSAQTTAR